MLASSLVRIDFQYLLGQVESQLEDGFLLIAGQLNLRKLALDFIQVLAALPLFCCSLPTKQTLLLRRS
jgi:hypothetical protein